MDMDHTYTDSQYVVNTLYWPHTALSVYLVCYFLVPHTHVLCMGSGSATGKKIQVRLVHSLLKYFFKFQLWYWIKNLHYQIFKFVIDNSDISLNCLQHIQKRRNFDAKVTCHQPICLLLHAILSGVGVDIDRWYLPLAREVIGRPLRLPPELKADIIGLEWTWTWFLTSFLSFVLRSDLRTSYRIPISKVRQMFVLRSLQNTTPTSPRD